jgi:LPXTG-site transpeptidase (sortase) family protein
MEHEHIKVHFAYNWLNEIWERKVPFFAVFFAVASLSYAFLYSIDFYPELVMPTSTPATIVSTTTTPGQPPTSAPTTPQPSVDATVPLKIVIEALDRTVSISNPTNDDVDVLDNALLTGAIRYPGSATFEKPGTMVLLGHSSYLPVVQNKSFQAFNGIQKLEWGDIIRIQSKDTEYIYRVQKVSEAKASTSEVPLQWKKAELILVTCNTFGAKEDRFIVEAYLIDQKPLKASAGVAE